MESNDTPLTYDILMSNAIKISRRHKKSSSSSPPKPHFKAEDIIVKLEECLIHFKCEKIPNVELCEHKKQYNGLFDTYKEPKISLGISSTSDKTGQVTKVVCTNFIMEPAMILAIQNFAEVAQFNVTVLILENCNLTADNISSLSELLSKKQILEELSLNGNPNDSQNHYLLLQFPKLWSCSLKFCGIDKEGMTRIADEVVASTSLLHLNLAGNLLYDEGMEPVADMLRVNRTLLCLNLTDNKIRNEGCVRLMKSFKLFTLRYDEVVQRRRMLFQYFREKLLKTTMTSTSISDADRKSRSARKIKDKTSLKSSKAQSKKKMVPSAIETEIDHHPFIHDVVEIGSDVCCKGNDVLLSLNLSYNQIGLTGLKCIEHVIDYQKSHFGNKGLSRLILEGNITTEESVNKIGRVDVLLSQDYKKFVSPVKLRKSSKIKSA